MGLFAELRPGVGKRLVLANAAEETIATQQLLRIKRRDD